MPEVIRAMYFIGMDMHKMSSQACVNGETGRVIINERFPSNVGAINAFLDNLGTSERKVVIEATGFYRYICDAIDARGYMVALAHPLNLKTLTVGRTKNDGNDAKMLAELLRIDAVSPPCIPPKEIRELRELTCNHSSLVVESTILNAR